MRLRNLYLTETTLTCVAIVLGTSVAFGHVKDGYRDTGCDPAMFTDIVDEDGNVLYRNNPTCPVIEGNSGFMFTTTPVAVEPETPVEPEPEKPVKPHKPEKPVKPHSKPHRA